MFTGFYFFVNRQILKYRNLIINFADSFFTFIRVSTQAIEGNSYNPWEFDRDRLKQFTTTLGAKWASDGDGGWHLFKPDSLETHTAVFEFLEYFKLKHFCFMGHEAPKKIVFIVDRLSSAVDIGLPIKMKYFKNTGDTKNND